MDHKKEKNIEIFNQDTQENGAYIYSNKNIYSARIATKRQTDELIIMFNQNFNPHASVLDVGCGDGTFTKDLLDGINVRKMTGFDCAEQAVSAANKTIKTSYPKQVLFEVCDIYDTAKKYKKGQYDVGVIRGVLHHLYQPQKAIASVCKVTNDILVLEPNGYNPILKIIEKISPYHRLHEEKSYPPFRLNKWFKQQGFKVREQRFFSIVPYFCNQKLAKILEIIQPFIEKFPLLNKVCCGTVLIYYSRK